MFFVKILDNIDLQEAAHQLMDAHKTRSDKYLLLS